MAEEATQNLAQALFAVILDATLVALQGPRMTGDAAAMKKVFTAVDSLQVALDDWFAVQAGFKDRPVVEAIEPITTAADITKKKTPKKKIIIATEVPKPKVYGNIPTKGKDARRPLPPTRVRGRNQGGQDDPFTPQFHGRENPDVPFEIEGDQELAREMQQIHEMEAIGDKILGVRPEEKG